MSRQGPPRSASPAPDALAPPPRHPRFPLLDGMRAVAVLAVVLVHVAIFSGVEPNAATRLLLHLNVGVAIFFLISGFLLYRPFVAHRSGGPPAPAIGDYAKRRLLRILPAYWLVLTTLVVLPGVTGVIGGGWALQYALLQTLPLASEPTCVSSILDCGLAQTWSLAVEMSFYAALPLYVIAAARIAPAARGWRWARGELLLLAAFGVVSVLLQFVVVQGGLISFVGGTVGGFMLWFGLGMGLAVASVALDASKPEPAAVGFVRRHPSVPWIVAIALYVLLARRLPATPFVVGTSQQLEAHVSFAAIALLLMLPAVLGDREGGLPRRLLALPAVAWLGLVSYGVFLWHYVVVIELGSPGRGLGFLPLLAATLAITIPIAAASYYAIERPLLRLKHRSVAELLGRGAAETANERSAS